MARRNVYTLTSAEWAEVVRAFNAVKASGAYDDATKRHQKAMSTLALYPGENGSTNEAHRGPGVLPWHREFLLELEKLMQAAVPGVEVPYWPWHKDGSTWRDKAKIWTLVGGNGNGYRVTTGPFASWNSVILNTSTGGFVPRAGIIRAFAASGSMPSLPTSMASAPAVYDAPPWSEMNSLTSSFRRWLENFHNQVHNLVRGDMVSGTSPNDPLFYLHHSNVDRLWAIWESIRGQVYLPASGGPPGHNLNDTMRELLAPNVTPAMMLTPPSYDNLVL